MRRPGRRSYKYSVFLGSQSTLERKAQTGCLCTVTEGVTFFRRHRTTDDRQECKEMRARPEGSRVGRHSSPVQLHMLEEECKGFPSWWMRKLRFAEVTDMPNTTDHISPLKSCCSLHYEIPIGNYGGPKRNSIQP